MPIRPENKHRYPSNWGSIRAVILERAGRRCEACHIPNYAWRNKATGRWTEDAGLAEAWLLDGFKVTRIVLTIAHLDHQPEHNVPENLKALCQRCHLQHDFLHHRETYYATRHAPRAIRDLFDG